MPHAWLEIAKRMQALAQAGLTYAENGYDRERYEELQTISLDILHRLTDEPVEKIRSLFTNETGYQTPKVDVRAVVFEGEKILMVRENTDNRWSLPGGWADVGYSPKEVAIKEVREEAGLVVEPTRLLALLDKKCHPHPPSPFHIYKVFILCRTVGGELVPGLETNGVGYFAEDRLPDLSLDRITETQIRLMFELASNPGRDVAFD
ncbi:MAG: NUDIX hydrolase [Ferruginibacter sp.]|nr:NUDIX hydrolase [Cytophagales bacterium]